MSVGARFPSRANGACLVVEHVSRDMSTFFVSYCDLFLIFSVNAEASIPEGRKGARQETLRVKAKYRSREDLRSQERERKTHIISAAVFASDSGVITAPSPCEGS